MKKEAFKNGVWGKCAKQNPRAKSTQCTKKIFLITTSANNKESIKARQILRGGGNKQWGTKQCA